MHEKDLRCINCGKKLTGKQKKYCSSKCSYGYYYKNHYDTKNKSCFICGKKCYGNICKECVPLGKYERIRKRKEAKNIW